MAYKINGRGSFVVDCRYRELGRIRRASGINNQKMLRKLHTMMDNLYENGRLDVLRDIKDGVITPLQAYEFWRTQQIENVPSVATLKPIVPEIPVWLETHDIVDKTRKGYREHFNAFLNVISPDTKILDLPLAAERYRIHCVEHGTHRAFNLVRSILQAFLNSSFGRHHALWQQVSNIKPLRTEPKRHKRILTPGEFLHLYDELCIMKANVHADMAETMVFTGMNFHEYASGDWEVLVDRVVIHGTKRESRARVVPRVHTSYSQPQRAYKAFRLALMKASENMDEYILKSYGPHVTTHSLRATFAHWLEMAKIPRSRRLSYLGHSGGDTLGKHYERHELDSYLLEDAKRFRDYIRQAVKDHRAAWNARIETLVTGKVAEYFQQRERNGVDSIWALESDSQPGDSAGSP